MLPRYAVFVLDADGPNRRFQSRQCLDGVFDKNNVIHDGESSQYRATLILAEHRAILTLLHITVFRHANDERIGQFPSRLQVVQMADVERIEAARNQYRLF